MVEREGNYYRFIKELGNKIDSAGNTCAPKYKELSIRTKWDYIKKVLVLIIYISDYTSKKRTEKVTYFLYMDSLHCGELKTLMQKARKKRSVSEELDKNEFIEVTEEIIKEIDEVFTQDSKIG